jgi:tetratricopeptide (TPR) repeat protein
MKYRQLEESLKKDPNNIDLLYTIALTEDQLGQTNSALNHYQKALSLSPRDEDVLKNIGLIYLKMGKADLAQDYLIRAASLNANNDEITLALGKAYFALGKYQNALESYLKLKDKTFHDEDINYFIAMTYGKLNNQGESHYYFGLYFKKAKKKESALFHFKEALNYFPQGSERNNAINQAIKELNADEHQPLFRKSKH